MRTVTTAFSALMALAILLAITLAPGPPQRLDAEPLARIDPGLLMQSSFSNGPECSNLRTFCRADVSRCEQSTREREQWRQSCLAPHKARYEECLRTARPNLNGQTGPEARQKAAQALCARFANYESKCQVEPQICPTYGLCEGEFSQCVQAQTEALRQGAGARRDDEQDNYYTEPYRAEPQRTGGSSSRSLDAKAIMDRARANADEASSRREQMFRYAQLGNFTGLERLVGNGLSFRARDLEDNTLLHAAAGAPAWVPNENLAMIEQLLAKGLGGNAINKAKQTPLMLAMERRIDLLDYDRFDELAPTEPYRNDVLHLLLDNTAWYIAAPGTKGLTLLHVAALDYDAEMVKKLLERGVPADRKDDFGRTPRDIALKKSPEFAALFPAGAKSEGQAAPVARDAKCVDRSLIAERELDRYRQLERQGALKFCDGE